MEDTVRLALGGTVALSSWAVSCWLSTGQEELMRDAWGHLVEVEGTVSGDPETNAPLAVRRVTDVRLFFDDPLSDRWLSARGAARSPDSRPV